MNRISIVAGAVWIGMLLHASAASEVVVSMRYFQDQGASHSHLYLYREDGKLLRQLTDAKDTDDANPFFSPDGSVIVFTQYVGKTKQYWSIEPLGKDLHALDAAPDWYLKIIAVGHTTDSESYLNPPKLETDVISTSDKELKYRLPGGGDFTLQNDDASSKMTIIVKDSAGQTHQFSPDTTAYPGQLEPMDKDDLQHFLWQPENGLRLAFINVHLDSTDGDQLIAVDLNDYTTHALSCSDHGDSSDTPPGTVNPIALPGEAAFLSWSYVRYVGYGTEKKTENSDYIEWRDSKFNQVNYSKPGGGRCYGASMYRGETKPSVIWMPWVTETPAYVDDAKGLIY